MYTAAILMPNSADLLRWMMRATLNLESKGFVCETAAGEQLPSHMTINLGAFDVELNDPNIVHTTIFLHVEEFVYCELLGVCAVPVVKAITKEESIVRSSNKIPHITICIKSESKPKFSNALLEQRDEKTLHFKLDRTYVLEALVTTVK